MKDDVFKEIADMIKGLHNGAIAHIAKREFAEAAILYLKALAITEKIHYYEGMAITLFNMANLAVIGGDPVEALKNAADARDMFEKARLPHRHCCDLIAKLVPAVKKQGIQYEKQGKFQEAIDHFETCIPFADQKSQAAMLHEVTLLRKIIHDQKRK